ncbi:phage tail fiber protein [Arsukibacterium indicum]|uniref:Phage tail protein n=1 Tax=Arsukibacterium indicum TaxID=2848612 RepID=A0ABS6MGK1_9GAMM|nr:hypothetical protein [Arsukibacterium indicum]MBV2127913.1 hypothetical protein [Arsukibacterium indicum]
MLNNAGKSRAINAANTLALFSTNPGVGDTAAGTELSDAPYARQAAVFNAGVDNEGVSEALLNADVVFDLHLTNNQNVQFIGLFEDTTYLGYIVPSAPRNFTGEASPTRSFTVKATTTKITAANQA